MRWLAIGLTLLLSAPTELARTIMPPAAARPRPSRPKPKWLPHWRPLGPRNLNFYPRLVRLSGQTVPGYARATGAVAAIPPTYFDKRSGAPMGFCALSGKVVRYTPLAVNEFPERVLVIIRRRPKLDEQNLFVIDPSAIKQAVQQVSRRQLVHHWLVNRQVVRQLQVDLHQFDVVTMARNSCTDPQRSCQRSGLIASPDRLKVFYQPCQVANLNRLRRSCWPGSILLSGDGGSTISQAAQARNKVGLMFYPWTNRTD